jgi:hypothetical protein
MRRAANTPPVQTFTRDMFKRFDSELALAEALRRHSSSSRLFDGVTDTEDRKARARISIVMNHLRAEPTDDTSETFAEAFARIYGEPLEPTTPRRRK